MCQSVDDWFDNMTSEYFDEESETFCTKISFSGIEFLAKIDFLRDLKENGPR